MRRRKPLKKFSLHMKKTLIAVMLVVVIVFIVLIFRIFHIIEHDSDRYTKKVLSQQTYVSNELLYKRGEIRDRNGTALAISVKVYDLVISPKSILEDSENGEFTIQTLVDSFGLDGQALRELINSKPNSQYQRIDEKKGLTLEEKTAFEEVTTAAKEAAKTEDTPIVVGVWFEERYARKYPLASVGCNVIGFVDGEYGTSGIEQYYNSDLTGSNGREYGYFDSELKLQRTIMPAINGNIVVSSIDSNVQRIVQEHIAKFQSDMGAENVAIMLMNPQNGEIFAMASDTVFDLNNPRNLSGFYTENEIEAMSEDEQVQALSAIWKNFCVSNTYEPGSTFKPFTVAAALDEGTSNTRITYLCEGKMQVADYEIGCANRTVHGNVTVKGALMESCNCALMQIASSLGNTQFHKYMNLYGFGSKTGIDLYGEEAGIIHPLDNLNTVELATSSFGQTQNVTMVQMLSAFCSLINGGNYYQPHVVKEIVNEQGAVVKEFDGELVRQTVTSDTSDVIRDALLATVLDGTATGAKVSGFEIGGKTGTAEKRPVDEENYIVSFIGCAPVENPQVAIYVLIDQPHVEDQAHSSYATEFASKVMKDVLPFLGVYSDGSKKKNDDNTDE